MTLRRGKVLRRNRSAANELASLKAYLLLPEAPYTLYAFRAGKTPVPGATSWVFVLYPDHTGCTLERSTPPTAWDSVSARDLLCNSDGKGDNAFYRVTLAEAEKVYGAPLKVPPQGSYAP